MAAVVPVRDDPFRLAVLTRETVDRLPEEATARALTGGRRAVRLREATDGLTPVLKTLLDQSIESLIVLEGGGLPTRSKLRALLEKHTKAAVIGCYPDTGRVLDTAIRETLGRYGVQIEAEAMTYLSAHLGADRTLTRNELQKLALYVGDGGRVDLNAAEACIGDEAASSLDDAVHAAMAGDVAMADQALHRALAEGAAPVSVLRAMLLHVQRLHRVRSNMDAGMALDAATAALRPPVFFRRAPLFSRAVGLWPDSMLQRAQQILTDAEIACKRTGAPDHAICAETIASLARRAQSRNGQRR